MPLAAIIAKLRAHHYDLSVLTTAERAALCAAGQALNAITKP